MSKPGPRPVGLQQFKPETHLIMFCIRLFWCRRLHSHCTTHPHVCWRKPAPRCRPHAFAPLPLSCDALVIEVRLDFPGDLIQEEQSLWAWILQMEHVQELVQPSSIYRTCKSSSYIVHGHIVIGACMQVVHNARCKTDRHQLTEYYPTVWLTIYMRGTVAK